MSKVIKYKALLKSSGCKSSHLHLHLIISYFFTFSVVQRHALTEVGIHFSQCQDSPAVRYNILFILHEIDT